MFYYSLQTGMRGAFGKPQGTVARVNIGQPIISVRSADKNKAHVVEALRRAKFKFPGRQKVCMIDTIYIAILRKTKINKKLKTNITIH